MLLLTRKRRDRRLVSNLMGDINRSRIVQNQSRTLVMVARKLSANSVYLGCSPIALFMLPAKTSLIILIEDDQKRND